MGFYGDAIYYLPNGIAQDVINGVITPYKLDRRYQEYINLGSFGGVSDEQTYNDLLKYLSYQTDSEDIVLTDQDTYTNEQYQVSETITTSSQLKRKNLRFIVNNNNGLQNDIPKGTYYAIGFLDQHWLLINSTDKTFFIFDTTTADCETIFWKKNKQIVLKDVKDILDNFEDIAHKSKPTFGIGYVTDGGNLINDKLLPSGPCIIYKHNGIYQFYCSNGSQYKYNYYTDIWTRIQIEGNDIQNETITGGDANTQANIASGTIQGYNIKTDTIKGSYVSPGKDDMSISHLANQTIGRTNLGNKIITASKVADTAIHGKGNTSEWRHIATESIAGGENGDIAGNTIQQYNMADDSIGTDQIIDGNVNEDKLANMFWRYERFWYNSENADKGFIQQLDDFVSDESRINCDNYILTFDLSYPVKISDNIILSNGTYIGWKQYRWESYYLNNVTTNEYWLFNGAAQVIQKIKIDTDDINFDSITGGNVKEKGNIAPNTINEYNVDSTIASISQGNGQIPLSRDFYVDVNFKELKELLGKKTANEKGNNILIFQYYQDDTTTNHTLSDGSYIAWQYALGHSPMGGFMCSWVLWNFTNNQMFTWDQVTPNNAPEKQIWSLTNPIELSDTDKEKINNFIVRNDAPVELNTILDIKIHLESSSSKIQFIFYHQNESYQGLPSGQYLALPSLTDNSYNNRNNLLIELNSGRIYTLRRGSSGTVVVTSANGTTDISGMWQVFNYFNNTTITDDDKAEGEIILKNYCKFTDLPWSHKQYLISGYAIKTTDSFKLDSELVILAPTHIETYLKNDTEKTIIVTYKNSNGTNKWTINPGSTMPFGALYGPDLSSASEGEDTYNTAWLTKLKFTYVNANTITCNMELSEFVSAPW